MLKNYDYAKKLFSKILIIAFVSTIFLTGVFAQGTFTESGLKILKNKAEEKLKTTSYRSIYVSKNLKTNDVLKKEVSEFVPPNRKHYVIEEIIFQIKVDPNKPIETRFRDSTIEKIPRYTEWIYIGEKIFLRQGAKEKWKIYVESGDSYGTGVGYGTGSSVEKPEITVEYKLTSNQILRNRQCDLYEKITTRKYKNSTPFVHTESYWFNEEGFFIGYKSENEYQRETIDYEYDPEIKIEAPLKIDEVIPLQITSKPRANYTEEAKKNGTQGTVTLKITFLSNGTIGSISVVSGLPDGLNRLAIAAARNIKFIPEKKNGVAITVTKNIQFMFKIY